MAHMRTFRELQVWQRSIDLAVATYTFTEGFPKREQYALTDDIRRAAASISANIAEGFGRGRDTEFDYFLRVAYGSLCELESHIELAERLNLGTPHQDLAILASEVGKMLNGLRSKMNRKLPTNNG